MKYIFRVINYWLYFKSFLERKIRISNIDKNDLVLDVGSGDKPFWRADVIADKYLYDNQQRHSGGIVYDKNKIFIEADVENLPFKNKVFDFVFCSHLLEHVENPQKAISELVRVSKKGYIEVPSSVLELFQPFPSHLWYCSEKDKEIIFRRKEKNNDPLIENLREFSKSIFKNDIFQYLLNTNKIFIRLYWSGNVKYKMIKSANENNVYKYKESPNINNKDLFLKISFIIYFLLYKILAMFFYKKKTIDIKSLLK